MTISSPPVLEGGLQWWFDKDDWNGPWTAFLIAFKDMVPLSGRTYDKETSIWTVSKEHVAAFRELKEEYFGPDPNQGNLFDGGK